MHGSISKVNSVRRGTVSSVLIGYLTQFCMISERRRTFKAYGSMVGHVTKSSDARRLLTEGFFHVEGESGYH